MTNPESNRQPTDPRSEIIRDAQERYDELRQDGEWLKSNLGKFVAFSGRELIKDGDNWKEFRKEMQDYLATNNQDEGNIYWTIVTNPGPVRVSSRAVRRAPKN